MAKDVVYHKRIAYVRADYLKDMYQIFNIAFDACRVIQNAEDHCYSLNDCMQIAEDAVDRIDKHSHPLPFHPHPDGKING